MVYMVGLSPSTSNTGSDCGCGGSQSTSDVVQLSMLDNILEAPLIVPAGSDYREKICFTRGCLSDAIYSVTAGTDGVATFSDDYDICLEAGDKARVIGYDSCDLDFDNIYDVAAVDDTANSVTLTGFQVDEDEVFSASLTTEIIPLGCTTVTESTTTAPPRIIEHVDANDIVLTGGAHARADYYNSMGVTTAAGNNWIVSKINKIVLPGDTITISDAGITIPTKVLETREVETNAGTVTYIRLEDAPTSSGCYIAVVRRGLLFTIRAELDANGCMDIYIPGSQTSKIQLHQDWLRSGWKDQFVAGRYNIFAHWGEINPTTNQMVPRSRSIMGGDMILQSTHLFNTAA